MCEVGKIMSLWEMYNENEKKEYIKYLKIYGSLSNLFFQKKVSQIPYLDSKFQETIFSKVFRAESVDIGNTPHDVLSIINGERIGIGLKTWMNSRPSFQKVMQLKRYKIEIDAVKSLNNDELLALKLSTIKNEKLLQDYIRLGLSEDKNIYHYITRDKGKFTLNETSYKMIDLNKITNFKRTDSSFIWEDGEKIYKYTYADSQIWQRFSSNDKDTKVLTEIPIEIMEDPFQFLIQSYDKIYHLSKSNSEEYIVAYLPLYSYRSKKVELKSGLNAWNSSPKNINSNLPRPDREIYLPIPIEFHKRYPSFFTENIFEKIYKRNQLKKDKEKTKGNDFEVRFKVVLPNGDILPCLITADNMKQFQSGGYLYNSFKRYGQSDLGNWILNDVLNLENRQIVTMDWLRKKGTDSIKIWRKINDYSTFYIDFAPVNSFELFMNGYNPIEIEED